MKETNYTTTEEILLKLGALLDTNKKRSFLNGSVVKVDEVRMYLDQAMKQLEIDFQHANGIIRDRDTILSNAHHQAEEMISQVEYQIRHTDISVSANEWADNRIAQAERIYDEKMEEMEIQTDEIYKRTHDIQKKIILDTHFYVDEITTNAKQEIDKIIEITSNEFTNTFKNLEQIRENAASLVESNRLNLQDKMHSIEEEQTEETPPLASSALSTTAN